MQLSFFDQAPISAGTDFEGLRRRELGQGAWVDFAPNWLGGQLGLFDLLRVSCPWQVYRRQMYDREVEVPRLISSLAGEVELAFSQATAPFQERLTHVYSPPASVEQARDAVQRLRDLGRTLSAYYRRKLAHISLAYYRDGRDSVAYHGDKLGKLRHNTVVAILSVGATRRFLLRPAGGGAGSAYVFQGGDLLVMGGTCQATFEHAIAKQKKAGPRIAIMFRESCPSPSGGRSSHIPFDPSMLRG